MKTMKIIISLIMVLALIVSFFSAPAGAEMMTAASLGAGLIAVAQSAGAVYSSSQQSAAQLEAWAQSKITSYLNGRSMAEVFGGEYIRLIAGKMVIPAVIYNAIMDMINEDVEDSGATPQSGPISVSELFYDRVVMTVPSRENPLPFSGPTVYNFGSSVISYGVSVLNNGNSVSVYLNGEHLYDRSNDIGGTEAGEMLKWGLYKITDPSDSLYNMIRLFIVLQRDIDDEIRYWAFGTVSEIGFDNDININLKETWEKDVIDVGYQWEGTIDGASDTNIDELVDTIYKDAALDTLGVSGEVETETPYPPQPTEYPIDDILGGMDTINQSVNDAGKDVTDAIGSVVDGIHSQTGAINDAASAVSEKVQSLEDTLTDALDVPTNAEASGFKWDLSQLFPFCIPFDIAAMYQAFDGVAAAPNIQIPIVIPSFGFSYTMQFDFSPFNGVAAILRQVELIAFGLALAWGTSKVIRW